MMGLLRACWDELTRLPPWHPYEMAKRAEENARNEARARLLRRETYDAWDAWVAGNDPRYAPSATIRVQISYEPSRTPLTDQCLY